MANLNYGFRIMRRHGLFGRAEDHAFFEDPGTYTALTYSAEGIRSFMSEACFVPTPEGGVPPEGWFLADRMAYLRMQATLREALPEHDLTAGPDDVFDLETFLSLMSRSIPPGAKAGLPEGKKVKARRGLWLATLALVLAGLGGLLYIGYEATRAKPGAPIDAVATIATESGLADVVDTRSVIDRVKSTAAGVLGASDGASSGAPDEQEADPAVLQMRESLQALQSRR